MSTGGLPAVVRVTLCKVIGRRKQETTGLEWHNLRMSPSDPPPGGDDAELIEEAADVELYGLVARRLKDAHARVRALDVSDAERAALTRSLLMVTEAAKRDLPEAARRLARFVADLDGPRPTGRTTG
ncbi:hypothetical protein ABH931_003236 [Streptacidiphilus sp. MAP12-33]